jgi:tetratricopeptide (TPR) repeat protein
MTTACFPRHVAPSLLVLAALGLSACSEDPQQASQKFAARADGYVARQQYKEASIEYRNALKAVPNDAATRYKLGRAYQESGDLVNAYAEFARAADLDPSNVDAQMRAGTLLLAAREFDAARTRAELALKADPSHVPAHILLGNANAGLNESAAALRQIEQAISLDPSYAPAWTALGAVTFIGGRRVEAADAFRKAVALDAKSVDARIALANYQWATGATADAEHTLKAALALSPQNASAHRALALLYVTTRRPAEAEPHYRALAGDVSGQLALADFYMGLGRNAEALALLQPLEQAVDKNDVRAARLRISSVHYAMGKKAEAHRILDQLIKERPRYAEARTAKARMLISDGAPVGEAVAQAREAVKADASLASAQYTLGLAALAARNLPEAQQAFEEAARLSPRAAAARIQLARIHLARGDTAAAVSAAELATRERPTDTEAAVMLARSLRAEGSLDRAGRELSKRIAANPESAPLHMEMGWLSLQRRQPTVARASFEEALRTAPTSYDARNGLITVDLAEHRVDAARARIAEWQKGGAPDPRTKILGAQVEVAGGNLAGAEQILKEVIAADASQLDAYQLLGRVYRSQGKIDQAVQQYELVAQRAPSEAAAAKTMIGMLYEAQNKRNEARTAYEQALAADGHAGVAANNLAWIHATDGRLDDALRFATIAQETLRRRPEAEDTIGWVYLQKGMSTQALAAFERARDRAPQNAIYHYHLGLAHQKMGDNNRARAAFTRALELKPDFNGADDARTQLAEATTAAK